jgi:hypothetical protein
MANVFLTSGQTYNAATSGDVIFGTNSAADTVNIFPNVTGLVLDQNVETVQLTGAASDYRYKQSGNQLEVYAADGTTLITTAPLQGDADGTGFQFGSSAVVSAVLSNTGVMTLGGSTVSATTVGAVTPGAGGESTITESVFSLTSGTETVTGTDGDDTIIDAVTSALSSARTFDVTDVIDGGDGADSLNLTMNAAFAGFSTGSMTNVETVNLTNASAISRTFDATGITGVETYNIDATEAAVTLTDLEGAVTVNVSNQSDGNFTTAFATGADTSDAMTVGLTNMGTADDDSTDADETETVTVTIADIEALTLNVTGVNVVDLGGTDLTDLTIAGAGSLEMANVSTSLETVDAAEATGDLELNLTNAGANSLTSIATGSGDDTVTINAEDTLANASIDLGEGTDTLFFGAMGGARTVQYALAGAENLEIGAIGNVLTFSGTDSTGMESIVVDSTADEDASFVNMGSGDYAFVAQGANANGAVITSTHTGASTVSTVASADTIADPTATETNTTDFTLTETSAVTVNVGQFTTYNGEITAAEATQLVVNVATGLDADDDETEITVLGATSVITAAAAEAVEFTAQGQVAAGAQIVVDAAQDGTFTFGDSADDGLNIQAEAMESVTIAAGGALDLSGSDLSAAQIVTLTAGAGEISGAVVLSAVNTLTISGTDDDAAVTLGNLGGDNDYGMSIEATGLASNLTLGTVDVSAGFDIDGTFDGVTGDVTIDDIGATTQGRNVNLSFAGTGGDVTVGTIDATGTITVTSSADGTLNIGIIGGSDPSADVEIDLDGQTGATGLLAISGDNVTIDAANALAAVTYDVITVTTSATITGSVLNANILTVAFDATDNDVSGSVVGGIGDDIIVVRQVDDTKVFTSLTINGGIGTDTVLLEGNPGAITIDSLTLTGIEAIQVDDTNAVTVNADALSGLTATIEGIAANDILILEGTTGADTLDYSGLTDAGNLVMDMTINLNGGADEVTLTGAGQTVDIVVFDANSSGVSLTGFETAVDHLDLSDINALFVTGNATIGTGATAAIDDGEIVGFEEGAVGTADTGFADTAAELVTLINDGTSGATLAAGDEFIAITSNAATGSTELNIWYVNNATGTTLSADEVTLIGTLTDITDVTGIAAGDFS